MTVLPANHHGFTLIEVMVALAIFAAAAAMLMLSDGNNIRHTRYLQEKVLAAQVADHHANTLLAEQRWPEPGVRGHVQTYAGHHWYVQETVVATTRADFRQITTAVFRGEAPQAAPLFRLISYSKRPAA